MAVNFFGTLYGEETNHGKPLCFYISQPHSKDMLPSGRPYHHDKNSFGPSYAAGRTGVNEKHFIVWGYASEMEP
jgi:hypothetical protein